MSRPQITVNVSGVLPRRGAPTDTGTAFMVYAGATGPAVPTVCLSAADATAASVPAAQAAWVSDVLEQGAPRVIVLRAAAVNAAAVTQTEWTTALAKLTKDLGPGQVFIPGVATAAAYAALLAHSAANTTRVVLLDSASVVGSASALATTAAGLASASGSIPSGMFSGWTTVPVAGGTTRDIPGSVIAAALAARGDAVTGHANNAPIFDQSRGIGVVRRGTAVTTTYTDAEADMLYDAGVNTIRMVNGAPTLTGWRSLTDATVNPVFRQLNVGRLATQLVAGFGATLYPFEGRQVDGRKRLFSEVEGAVRGYLLNLYNLDALYGDVPGDAFQVDVSSNNNTPATIAAGELHAAAAVTASNHTEQILFDIVVATAEGAAA